MKPTSRETKRKVNGVLLSLATVCLLSTPLLGRQPLLLLMVRIIGATSGSLVCLSKPEDELTWLEEQRDELRRTQDEMNTRYIQDTEMLAEWAKAEASRLEQEAQQQIEVFTKEASGVISQHESEAERWRLMYEEAQSKVESYLLPKKPTGISRLDVVSGRIIDFFFYHGIVCDYEDSWTEDTFDLIRVEPRSGGLQQFEKLLDQLQLELKLSEVPTVSITQGCVQFRLITLLKEPKVTLKSDRKEPKFTDPTIDYILGLLNKFPSFRINGESGSGKSTFTSFLLNNIKNDNTRIVVIDPKYPMSDWVSLNPSYKGIEEAFDGLQEASDLVETRLKLARADAESVKPIRTFNPVLFVIDEIDWVISHYGKEATELLRVTLKVGRALNVQIMYVGQTPLCSRLKMNKDDFRHSVSFFLGENIPASIDEVVLTSVVKERLLTEYETRVKQGSRYHCLVKHPGKEAFLMSLPNYKNGNSGTQDRVKLSVSQPPSGTCPPKTGTNYGTENNQNLDSFVEDLDFDRNYGNLENGNRRNLEENGDNLGSERVPSDLRENGESLLSQGLTKSHIIKEHWGYSGRKYQLGLDLWDKLGLP